MKSYISKKRINSFTLLLCLLPLLLLSLSECALADNNIYRDLINRDIATYEDGCRAFSCFVDVPAEKMTFEEVVAELEEKEIVEKGWKYNAEKPLTCGMMAYMLCKILKIKGGLTMRVIDITKRFALPDIGMGKRYAYLEIQRMGLLPSGKKKPIKGHDLLAVLYRLEQYIKMEEMEKKREEVKKKANEQKKAESE